MTPSSENCALPVAAVVTVLTCVLLHGAQAGVVGDFNHAERCKDSLYMGTPPRGYLSNSFKKICQRYEDKPRYVTLYDSHKHVPIYSAYTFKKSDGEKKVDFPWMFEPQVSVLSILIEVQILVQMYYKIQSKSSEGRCAFSAHVGTVYCPSYIVLYHSLMTYHMYIYFLHLSWIPLYLQTQKTKTEKYLRFAHLTSSSESWANYITVAMGNK